MQSQDHILATSRLLPYSASAIYAAFSDPLQLAAWWGPKGFRNTFTQFNFNTGGQWVFTMHGPDGNDYPNTCVFQQLVPEQRIVIRHSCAPLFTLDIELQTRADATLLLWRQIFDEADTAQALKTICLPANEDNLDRLSAVLSHKAV
jgi:uncharacterized protein YndB with AHSA1/START domain